MAVQSDTSRISYAGNNSTSTSYAVPFVFLENAHLQAIARTSAGVESTVTLTNHTGAGNVNGGTVRTSVAIPATSTLTIYREVPITQTTIYQEGGDFPAASHEDALDKLTYITQQLDRRVDTCIRGSEVTPVAPVPSPTGTQQFVLATTFNQPPAWQPQSAIAIGPVIATGSSEPRFVSDRFADMINVKDFGAVGNGVADDTAAIQAAAAQCVASGKSLYCPAGLTINLVGSVNLKNIKNICFESDINITGTLTVGGNANAGKFSIALQAVTNGTSTLTSAPPASPVLRVTGVANSEITVGACNYLQLYADAAVSAERLVAYNQIRLTGPTSLLEITDSGVALSYVNENFIYGGRIQRYKIIKVGYAHNHNKLFNPTMEGSSVEIVFAGVHVNQIYGARFEDADASLGITFDADSYSNTVVRTWSGTGSPRNQFLLTIPVSDAGQGNLVTTESAFQFNKTTLFNVSPSSQILSSSTDTIAADPRIAAADGGVFVLSKTILTPSLKGFSVTSNRWIALSEPIPVKIGDVIAFDGDFDGALLRTAIFVLDQNMGRLLDDSGGIFISQSGSSFSSTYGYYAPAADQAASNIKRQAACVVRPEVKFIRVGMFSATGGFFRSLSAFIYTQTFFRNETEGAASFNVARSIAGPITSGFVPQNVTVYDRTVNALQQCTYQYETTLNGALSAGDTSVTVTAAASIANDDLCGILLDDETTHWTTVSALSGATFTIAAIPAGRSAPNGGRIVFNRWSNVGPIKGSATYDPPSLSDGTGVTTTVTVTGAAVGDYAEASFSNDLQGIALSAWVSAADTVSVRFQNETASAILEGSATYDPASLDDGDGATTTATVTGAALGDFVEASFSLDLQGITTTAWVSAADTVSVRFQNETGGTIDLGSGTLRARVRPAAGSTIDLGSGTLRARVFKP